MFGNLNSMDDSNDIIRNNLSASERIQMERIETNEWVCGMFLGMILGPWIIIFIVWTQRYRVSRRFRSGILLGILLNLILQFYNGNDINSMTNNDGTTNAGGVNGNDGTINGGLGNDGTNNLDPSLPDSVDPNIFSHPGI